MDVRLPLPTELRQLALSALERAGEPDKIDQVERDLESGTSQLWAFGRSLIITKPCFCDEGRLGLFYHVVAGDLREVLTGEEVINIYARDQGCEFVKASGRTGWERVLRPLGWTVTKRTDRGNVYEKELADGRAI